MDSNSDLAHLLAHGFQRMSRENQQSGPSTGAERERPQSRLGGLDPVELVTLFYSAYQLILSGGVDLNGLVDVPRKMEDKFQTSQWPRVNRPLPKGTACSTLLDEIEEGGEYVLCGEPRCSVPTGAEAIQKWFQNAGDANTRCTHCRRPWDNFTVFVNKEP
jgi:hypothetical protein